MGLPIQKNFEYFLKENFGSYKDGEWVAISGEKVIAHGFDFKKVMEKSRSIVSLSKVLFSKVKKTASYL